MRRKRRCLWLSRRSRSRSKPQTLRCWWLARSSSRRTMRSWLPSCKVGAWGACNAAALLVVHRRQGVWRLGCPPKVVLPLKACLAGLPLDTAITVVYNRCERGGCVKIAKVAGWPCSCDPGRPPGKPR